MKISLDTLRRIVVAVDPAITSGDDADETGIIVVAEGPHIELENSGTVCRIANCNRHGYVLDDRSGKYTPDTWAHIVRSAFEDWKADRIVAEGNQGGEMVEQTIRTVFPSAPIHRVHARQGKRTRAEPIAALYEQGRVHHCQSFPKLEDQLTTWTPDSGESPDRLDALVWGLVELGLAQYGGARAAREWLESFWKNCPKCQLPNDLHLTHCTRCGAELPITEEVAQQSEVEITPFSLTSQSKQPAPNPQVDQTLEMLRRLDNRPWYAR